MLVMFQLGAKQQVLVTEISHDKQYFVAHNKSYDQVPHLPVSPFGYLIHCVCVCVCVCVCGVCVCVCVWCVCVCVCVRVRELCYC